MVGALIFIVLVFLSIARVVTILDYKVKGLVSRCCSPRRVASRHSRGSYLHHFLARVHYHLNAAALDIVTHHHHRYLDDGGEVDASTRR